MITERVKVKLLEIEDVLENEKLMKKVIMYSIEHECTVSDAIYMINMDYIDLNVRLQYLVDDINMMRYLYNGLKMV